LIIKKNFFFYNLPSFCFCLLPLFLITGPFLSDLSISLISLLFIIKCIQEKNFSYFKNKYFYFFILFYFYLVLNIIFNNFNTRSFINALFYFRFGIFVIALVYLLNLNKKLLEYFFIVSVICFSMLIFDGFIQYFFKANIFGAALSAQNRVSSFFGDELILGSYISRLLPIIFGISLIIPYKNKYLYLIPIFIFCETLVFLSGERAAFFFINLSSLFILLMIKDYKKLRFFIMIITGFFIIGITALDHKAKERIFDRTLEQINVTDSSKKIYIFSKQHHEHYLSAFRMFNENKIFGVGVNNFRELCQKEKFKVSEYSCVRHPHNNYIQVVAELGIIGVSFLIFLLIIFIIYSIKHIKYLIKGGRFFSDFEICLLGSILIFLWPIAPTGNFFNNWLNITYYLPLALFIFSRNKNNNWLRG